MAGRHSEPQRTRDTPSQGQPGGLRDEGVSRAMHTIRRDPLQWHTHVALPNLLCLPLASGQSHSPHYGKRERKAFRRGREVSVFSKQTPACTLCTRLLLHNCALTRSSRGCGRRADGHREGDARGEGEAEARAPRGRERRGRERARDRRRHAVQPGLRAAGVARDLAP